MSVVSPFSVLSKDEIGPHSKRTFFLVRLKSWGGGLFPPSKLSRDCICDVILRSHLKEGAATALANHDLENSGPEKGVITKGVFFFF